MSIHNEDIAEYAIKVSFTATKITAEVLLAVVTKAQEIYKNHREAGKQSIKTLSKKGSPLEKVDLSYEDASYKDLKKALQGYGLDYALMKNGENSYELWYKKEDGPRLQSALEQIVRMQMKQTVKDKVKEHAEKAAQYAKENVFSKAKEMSMEH